MKGILILLLLVLLCMFETAWSCGSRRRKKPKPTPPPLPSSQCGQVVLSNTFVIAGETSRAGQWPWQIALYRSGSFLCGGSLVSAKWIITAAHCLRNVADASSLSVVLGDLRRSDSTGQEQTRTVKRFISHELFSFSTIDYDIALLELNIPAVLTNNVATVCLPYQGEEVPVGTNCFISGWGKITSSGSSVDTLQHARLQVISNYVCSIKNSRHGPITNRMICANGGGLESGCHGDSGGPFVCKQPDNTWKLHGVVSWGSPFCSINDANSVFARVSELSNWVTGKMNGN